MTRPQLSSAGDDSARNTIDTDIASLNLSRLLSRFEQNFLSSTATSTANIKLLKQSQYHRRRVRAVSSCFFLSFFLFSEIIYNVTSHSRVGTSLFSSFSLSLACSDLCLLCLIFLFYSVPASLYRCRFRQSCSPPFDLIANYGV